MCDLRILRPLVMTAGYDCYEPWSLSRVELCTTKHSKGNCHFGSEKSAQITITTSDF